MRMHTSDETPLSQLTTLCGLWRTQVMVAPDIAHAYIKLGIRLLACRRACTSGFTGTPELCAPGHPLPRQTLLLT